MPRSNIDLPPLHFCIFTRLTNPEIGKVKSNGQGIFKVKAVKITPVGRAFGLSGEETEKTGEA